MIQDFQIGDKVIWTSQSRGTYVDHKGKIVRIVEKSEGRPYRIAEREFPKHRKMFDGFTIPGGQKILQAYLIEIQDNVKRKPKLYMPYPQKLRKVA